MPQADSDYLARVSSRIVRMFELYAKNINPEEQQFKVFISNYLTERGVRDSQALPYSALYKAIKDGIREYLRQHQTKTRS